MWSAPNTTTTSGWWSWIRLMFWYTASAVPWNHSGPIFIWGGTTATKCSLISGESTQFWRTCSISDWDLYCTSR